MYKKSIAIMAFALTLAASLTAGTFSAHAEDPVASVLDTSDVKGFLGLWKVTLTIEALGNQKIELFLNFADVDGKIGATLDSANQPEPLAISSIEADSELDGGLDMNSVLKFGGSFTIDINLKVHLEGDGLGGVIKDKGGLLTADVVGERMSEDELDAVQGRRPAPTEARLNIKGKIVRIAFASLSTEESDWEAFQNVGDGEVFQFATSRATKIYTDFDLKFGDTVVEKENMAPGYPGVYSVWLKRTGDGWNLVFNSQSDIWGTRYLPEHDVVEVPLKVTQTSGEPKENFVVTLEQEDGNQAAITLAWGNTEWSAKCTMVQ